MLNRIWSSKPVSVEVGLLLLRVSVGLLMLKDHGLPKLLKFDSYVTDFYNLLGIGSAASLSLCIFAELFCSGFLMVGLFSRAVLIPLIFNMLIIVFVVHGDDSLKQNELPVLFLIAYVALLLCGPGRWSADRLLKK
ncbi:MAG TPA: DoxX family protein [Cyclobacteriaceae bacterium]|nr:DoxX family protein [Cyclobacteriaceae bacterium]